MSKIDMLEALRLSLASVKNYIDANALAKDYGDTIILEVSAEKLLEEIEKAKAKGYDLVTFDCPKFEVDPNQEYYIEFDNKIQKMVIEDDYYEGLCLGLYPNYGFDYESGRWTDDETKILLDFWPDVSNNYTSENITPLIIKQRNIKQIDTKYISDNFEVLNSISMGRNMFSETGYHSTAIGTNCTASGVESFASGIGAKATEAFSHAEGYYTEASGRGSHAEGADTKAIGGQSHAEGSDTVASGYQSHAEGWNTIALGDFSHSEGTGNAAYGDGAHTEGFGGQYSISSTDLFPDTAPEDVTNEMALAKWKSIITGATLAIGEGAHAEGRSTLAAGLGAHSEGAFTSSLSRGTHSEGYYTTSIGNGAHAEGHSSYQAPDYFDEGTLINETNENIITKWKTKNFSLAKGEGAHAEGKDTLALGNNGSHAEGFQTKALDKYAHAEGCCTEASEAAAHAEGDSTKATGTASHAEGYVTVASGYASHAEGQGTIAYGDYQHVQGSYNIEDTENKYAHIVGNGTYQTPANIHTLDWDGNAWFAGKATVSVQPTENNDLTTKLYVDNAIAQTSIDTSGFALKTELFSKDYNDLTNKPFYETSELKLFTNDGDNTGRLIVNNGTTNIKFAKISEDEIDSSLIDQARFSMFVGDEGYEISDPSTFVIVENETGSAINLGEYVVCTFNDNFAMDMSGTIVTFPEKGLYFSFNVGSGHVWRLDNVYLPIVSAKQLDEKFIPDTIARIDDIPEGFSGDYNDLTNKPFYDSREYEDVVIEYDGNNEGRTMCSIPAMGLSTAYKVADLTAEQLEQYKASCADGFTLTYLKGDGSTEVVQSSVIYNFMGDPVSLYAGGIGQVFLSAETFSTEIGHADNYVNEAGVYFKENTGTNPYKVIKLEFKNVSGELKTIDPRFLTNSPGIKVEEGTSYVSEYNSQTYVAQNNAEIFNDTRNMATGQCSHAEGAKTEAHGSYSHAEGYSTYAIGSYSHAEGGFAKAIGEYSHTEGAYTKATGNYSHAEGYNNDAIGAYSHAEGNDNEATGECSHVEGYKTTAAGKWQHVQGVYNIEDTENKYAHIVGNGDYMYGGSGPSNAHTLDWDGNAWFQGDVFIKGTSQDDAQKLATEEFVTNLNNDVVESINEINTELETKASTEYVNNMLSGLRLVQMTQSEYDALEVKDSNTLYIII